MLSGGKDSAPGAGNPASPGTGPGRIQRGPVLLVPVKSGTRVWPEGGIQAAGHGPRWLRRRGDQPEPTGTGSTGGYRTVTSRDTVQREEGRGRRTLDLSVVYGKRPLTKGAPLARHRAVLQAATFAWQTPQNLA